MNNLRYHKIESMKKQSACNYRVLRKKSDYLVESARMGKSAMKQRPCTGTLARKVPPEETRERKRPQWGVIPSGRHGNRAAS